MLIKGIGEYGAKALTKITSLLSAAMAVMLIGKGFTQLTIQLPTSRQQLIEGWLRIIGSMNCQTELTQRPTLRLLLIVLRPLLVFIRALNPLFRSFLILLLR